MSALCRPAAGRPRFRLEAAREIPGFLQSYFDSAPLWSGRAVRLGDDLWTLLERCWSRPERERDASPLCRALIAAPGGGWLDEHDVIEGMARGSGWPDPSRLERAAIGAFIEAVLQDLAANVGQSPALRVELRFALAPPAVQTCFAKDTLAQALQQDGLDEVRIAAALATRQPDLAALEGVWCLETGGRRGRTRARRPAGRSFRIPIADRADHGVGLRLEFGSLLTGYFRRTLEEVAAVRAPRGSGD